MSKRRIQIDEFLTAYWKAVNAGMTREQFAKTIGVKPETVYQRVYELRRRLKERGQDLPLLPIAPRQSVVDRAEEIIERLAARLSPADEPQAEEEVSGVVEDPLADILG